MKNNILPTWIFVYSLNYLVWHVGIIFLNWEIANKLVVADVLDLLTPYIMILLALRIYWLLKPDFSSLLRTIRGKIEVLLIVLGIITFIEGHGMHLSANAIARHLKDSTGTPLFDLTYFFDEILGHILWDSGMISISVALIIRAFNDKQPPGEKNLPLLAVSSIFYGFTYFCNAVEGQTVFFMLPVSILLPVVLAVALKRAKRQKNPIALYFIGAYSFACILFIIWGIWQNGFPQFSELGWI